MTISIRFTSKPAIGRRISKLRRSKFARQSAFVVVGTGLSQLMPIFCAPVLSRIYAPADFGIYGVVTSLATIIAAVASWGYDRAIAISLSDKTAENLLAIAILLALITSAAAGLLGYMASTLWCEIGLPERLIAYIWFVPVIGLAVATTRVLVFWHTRIENHKTISLGRILQSMTQVAAQIAAGLAIKLNSGLLYGYLAGQLAFGVCLAAAGRHSLCRTGQSHISLESVREIILKHLDFPKYRAPQQLVVAIGKSGYLLAFATAFSPVHAGFFTLAQRVLFLPVFMLAQSVQQVFIPTATRIHADSPQKLERQVIKLTVAVALVCMTCILPVLAFGPHLFSLIFGESWTDAGTYARMLAVAVLFQATAHPAEALTPLLGIQRLHLVNQVVLVGAMATSIGIGYSLENPLLAVAAYAVTIACLKTFLFIQIIRSVRVHASTFCDKE